MKRHAETPDAIHGCAQVSQQWKHIERHAACIALLLLASSLCAQAGEPSGPTLEPGKPDRADLTFSNLSTGWNEPWTPRNRGDGAPDMSLLRVQTNFVTEVSRTDYAYQKNIASDAVRGTDLVTETLEYPFSRRFELALVGYYQWIDSRMAGDLNGAAEGAFARFQWVDTATSSLVTTLRVAMPNHDLAQKDTTVSLAVAGWQDLTSIGLHRVGIYYHLQEETLAGPTDAGSRRNDLTYAISLAKTWTSPESFLGNLSTFVETYGTTYLDGSDSGHTVITVTPGIRATIAKHHVFMAGVDFPLTNPNPFERIFRFTYIYCF